MAGKGYDECVGWRRLLAGNELEDAPRIDEKLIRNRQDRRNRDRRALLVAVCVPDNHGLPWAVGLPEFLPAVGDRDALGDGCGGGDWAVRVGACT